MLSRFAASHVKVALTGDGGDETGCGYDWHQNLCRFDAALAGAAPNDAARMARFRDRHRIPPARPIDRAGLWSILRTGLSDEVLGLLPLVDPRGHKPLSEYFREWSGQLDPTSDCFTWSGQMDLLTYLPDDLMVKSDRASMSVGLELREPLLDHNLTAWLLHAPASVRFDGETGKTKLPSRRFLASRLPTSLFDLPKHGFTAPLPLWLSGPLAESLNEALERLASGRLEPVVLPAGCKSWRDCDPLLKDEEMTFLWRVMCFSEWHRQQHSETHDRHLPRQRKL
jgi:asparagine synthase (glutamine-hydrolysing)